MKFRVNYISELDQSECVPWLVDGLNKDMFFHYWKHTSSVDFNVCSQDLVSCNLRRNLCNAPHICVSVSPLLQAVPEIKTSQHSVHVSVAQAVRIRSHIGCLFFYVATSPQMCTIKVAPRLNPWSWSMRRDKAPWLTQTVKLQLITLSEPEPKSKCPVKKSNKKSKRRKNLWKTFSYHKLR